MFRFRVTQTIRRRPEDVFGMLTRFEDIPKFVPQVVAAEQTSPGPVPVGTTFVQHGRLLRLRMRTPTTVTLYEPPRRFAYRGGGPLPYEASYTFTAVPEGTLLEADVVMSPTGPLRLIEPLLARQLPGLYRTNLERMRQVLEAGDAGAQPPPTPGSAST